MNAQEMYEIAKVNRDKNVEKQYKEIEDQIRSNAYFGQFELYLKSIYPENQKKLEELGFIVKWDISVFIIKWRKDK